MILEQVLIKRLSVSKGSFQQFPIVVLPKQYESARRDLLQPAILSVCRQIRLEGLHIYYKRNTFVIARYHACECTRPHTSGHENKPLAASDEQPFFVQWMMAIGRDNCGSISGLQPSHHEHIPAEALRKWLEELGIPMTTTAKLWNARD